MSNMSSIIKKDYSPMKIFLILFVAIEILTIICFVLIRDEPYFVNYSEKWIIGKTADAITERYGVFDEEERSYDSGKLCIGRYYIKDSRDGHFYKWWFQIEFNSDECAFNCQVVKLRST